MNKVFKLQFENLIVTKILRGIVMNLIYFLTKYSFVKKIISRIVCLILIGIGILLLKQEFNSLSPAATRMFNSISSLK